MTVRDFTRTTTTFQLCFLCPTHSPTLYLSYHLHLGAPPPSAPPPALHLWRATPPCISRLRGEGIASTVPVFPEISPAREGSAVFTCFASIGSHPASNTLLLVTIRLWQVYLILFTQMNFLTCLVSFCLLNGRLNKIRKRALTLLERDL